MNKRLMRMKPEAASTIRQIGALLKEMASTPGEIERIRQEDPAGAELLEKYSAGSSDTEAVQ